MTTGRRNAQQADVRFAFGSNWKRFLRLLTEQRIGEAEASIRAMLRVDDLRGRRFLDVGSGSGLFSLSARRLGATVCSFDYDPESVACTMELRHRFFGDDPDWIVFRGSVLDRPFVESLGRWDVVYSWGVLHHTGDMAEALANVVNLVNPGGYLFIAIYNDQGAASRRWRAVKKLYNATPARLRGPVVWAAMLRLWGPTMVRDFLAGRPLATWRSYGTRSQRSMSPWHDAVDWVGGYPFEVAKPEEIFAFYRQHGFELRELRTCGGGIGCNEFVFQAPPRDVHLDADAS